MLLDCDYRWCAETMVAKFGWALARRRAEQRARELLRDGNSEGHDIWMTVAAAIRQLEASTRAA
jgi:hypothetical protein